MTLLPFLNQRRQLVDINTITYPSGAPEITPSFWWGSCCLLFSFLFCVMCTIVCLFVLFICSHGVVSWFSIYEFDCPSCIFRPSFTKILTKPVLIRVKWNVHTCKEDKASTTSGFLKEWVTHVLILHRIFCMRL